MTTTESEYLREENEHYRSLIRYILENGIFYPSSIVNMDCRVDFEEWRKSAERMLGDV